MPEAARPGHTLLSQVQQARVRSLILGKLPDQLKLPFYLWTRQAVAQPAQARVRR